MSKVYTDYKRQEVIRDRIETYIYEYKTKRRKQWTYVFN